MAKKALEKEASDAVTGYTALSTLSALGKQASPSEIKNALVPLAKHKAGKARICLFTYMLCKLSEGPLLHCYAAEHDQDLAICLSVPVSE